MRIIAALLVGALGAAFGADFSAYEVPADKAADFAAHSPGVEWFPPLHVDAKALEEIPEAFQGTWFRVDQFDEKTVTTGDAAWRIGKMSRVDLLYKNPDEPFASVESDGKSVVIHSPGRLGGGMVAREIRKGLIVANLFSKAGKLTGRPEVYAVR